MSGSFLASLKGLGIVPPSHPAHSHSLYPLEAHPGEGLDNRASLESWGWGGVRVSLTPGMGLHFPVAGG